jgi:hypothetical protein
MVSGDVYVVFWWSCIVRFPPSFLYSRTSLRAQIVFPFSFRHTYFCDYRMSDKYVGWFENLCGKNEVLLRQDNPRNHLIPAMWRTKIFLHHHPVIALGHKYYRNTVSYFWEHHNIFTIIGRLPILLQHLPWFLPSKPTNIQSPNPRVWFVAW